MHLSRIYHISEGRQFPMLLAERGPFRMEIVEARPVELAAIQPSAQGFHIFVVQGERGKMPDLIERLREARHLADFAKIVLVPEVEYESTQKELNLIPRASVVDDGIRPRHFKLLLELILQQEYYRQTVYSLSQEVRQRSSVFDNLLELARQELRTSREESKAYRSLLEYESEVRRFEKHMGGAMEQAISLKDRELLGMKSQLAARERLSDYRDHEFKHAQATIQATEVALDMSLRENIERDRIIIALERLRSYTDAELMELVRENEDLRTRLGMPPREH